MLTGVLFSLLAYRFICSGIKLEARILRQLGDHSFGVFFSHLAVLFVLPKIIPGFYQYVLYPLSAMVAIAVSDVCVRVGRIIL